MRSGMSSALLDRNNLSTRREGPDMMVESETKWNRAQGSGVAAGAGRCASRGGQRHMRVGDDLDLRKVAPICELVSGVCRRFLRVSMRSGRLLVVAGVESTAELADFFPGQTRSAESEKRPTVGCGSAISQAAATLRRTNRADSPPVRTPKPAPPRSRSSHAVARSRRTLPLHLPAPLPHQPLWMGRSATTTRSPWFFL